MLKKIILFIIISSSFLFPQTKSKVDSTTAILDSLISISIRTWKDSPDIKCLAKLNSEEPTKSEFDDSKWDTLKLA